MGHGAEVCRYLPVLLRRGAVSVMEFGENIASLGVTLVTLRLLEVECHKKRSVHYDHT